MIVKGEYFLFFMNSNVIYSIITFALNAQSIHGAIDVNFLNENLDKSCVEKCPNQNQTNSYQKSCGSNCFISQCAFGCSIWKEALESSCKDVCKKKTEQEEDLYCVMGCNNAISRYFKWLSDEIGTPSAPALVADSLTATSLSLEWEIPKQLEDLSRNSPNITNYLVQWRYEEIGNDWKFCRNTSMGLNSTIRVENLQPYTKYRFRVALIISSMELHSEQSLIISTLAQGSPLSKPEIVRAVAVDDTRISISWESGPFTNGPILFYVLQIKESYYDNLISVQDVPATEKDYLIEKLTPTTNYTISLKMRNADGEGPAAVRMVATTNKPPPPSEDEKLKLILVSKNHILMEGSTYFYDTPYFIYNSTEEILGASIHVMEKLLFIVDKTRTVFIVPLDATTNYERKIVFTTERQERTPLALSVDWLNDKLYILVEIKSKYKSTYEISRCNFQGDHFQVVYGGLQDKPYHFEVDPYNGFLFYTIEKKGLYRIDLQDVSNGVKYEIQPLLIYDKSDTKAFTIDYVHFKILLVSETDNNVYAVHLDGRKWEPLRTNRTELLFHLTKSIVCTNELFYWTSGDSLLEEQKNNDEYYHNSFRSFAGITNFRSIIVKLPSAQPVPVPVNPPSNVQAILNHRSGKVSWRAPHLLGEQGRGAWQDWKYQIEITDEDDNDRTELLSEIKGLHYIVDNLRENRRYMIRVAAYTIGGVGPFSTEFHAQTFKTSHDRSLIWSSKDGLVQSDVLGENIQTLIPDRILNDRIVTDIAWYNNIIYFVCNSTINYYNTTSDEQRILSQSDVQAISIDWIGKRLYWFNPSNQMIFRGTLEGTKPELILSLNANKMVIDAIGGYIYFANTNAIEYSRLNGRGKGVYEWYNGYSAKTIMGLALDIERKRIYWIVRGYDVSTLCSAPLADGFNGESDIQRYDLTEKQIKGPLIYFSDRLLWLQDNDTIVISNLTGQNLAFIKNSKLNQLKAFTVLDPTQQSYPSYDDINVIPESVDPTSIVVSGTHKIFNITWKPIRTVNYGQVFYAISAPNVTRQDEIIHNFIIYNNRNGKIKPYSKIKFHIRAYTYWGSANEVSATIHSPSAAPTPPINPRMFITRNPDPIHGGINIVATFRWGQPESKNGELIGYKINCSTIYNPKLIDDMHIQPDRTEYKLEGLDDDSNYSCQVHAASTVDSGDKSEIVTINSNEDKPLPQLFVAREDQILFVDIDLFKSDHILSTGSNVSYLAYIAYGKQLFWINENNELMTFINEAKQRLHTISNATIVSLTVDWIDRVIYWAQLEPNEESSIHAFDLNKMKASLISKRPGYLTSLQAQPLHRLLLWIESEKKFSPGNINSYHLDTHSVQSFKNELNETVKTHNKILLFDSISNENLQIIWCGDHDILKWSDYRTGMTGPFDIKILPRMLNFVKDSKRFYWNSEDKIYAMDAKSKILQDYLEPRVNILYAITEQRYPLPHCLMPHKNFVHNHGITLHEAKDKSLILRLPRAKINDGCFIHPPGIEYQILYEEYNSINPSCTPLTCFSIETFEHEIEIIGLKPFTKYQFQFSVTNYFATKKNMTQVLSSVNVFKTTVGSPSRPRNVTAQPVSPTEAVITWLPPLENNAACVWYEIQWQTQNAIKGVKNLKQKMVSNENGCLEANLIIQSELPPIFITNLLPNEPYDIWVRAYTSQSTFNQSALVPVKTLPEPQKITLLNVTSKSLTLSWPPYQYTDDFYIVYRPKEHDKYEGTTVNRTYWKNPFQITGLNPKTIYLFTITLHFKSRKDGYIWPEGGKSFSFETLGDRPDAPGKPQIEQVNGDVYKITWTQSTPNGANIEEYNLEGLRYRRDRTRRSTDLEENDLPTVYSTSMATEAPIYVDERDPISDNWTVYYSGRDTYWIPNDLNQITEYSFRVRARNSYGWSEYSVLSEINRGLTSLPSNGINLIRVAVITPILTIAFIIGFIYIIFKYCCSSSEKKSIVESHVSHPDVELHNLRNLPSNIQPSANSIYRRQPITDSEVAVLPHVHKNQLRITKFLGKGAFGEVYEGVLLNGNEADQRIAIKTLRYGASKQEKEEFTQEAHLMSNFKHEHILRMIGVCWDLTTPYIIMELMEGGDLLNFLRTSRNCSSSEINSQQPFNESINLTLKDLISMCVDIASGCRYLEEMHFVHRDLACRNCLVSSIDPLNRVVKIGDFGLARDVYRSDYYRKNGEGLLPVRWMAPESLVYSLYTSQTDVWSFGIICWEIMALGQQPYAARSNTDVLSFVRNGGRLEQPENCPDELYDLMMKTWRDRGEDRPNFRFCLDVLQKLQSHFEAAHILLPCFNSSSVNGGIFNKSYLLADENHNSTNKGVLKYVNQNIPRTNSILSEKEIEVKTIIPHYLEVIHDENEDEVQISSPYEIPLPNLDEDEDTTVVHEINDDLEKSYKLIPNEKIKERTLSTSSTVSESSANCPQIIQPDNALSPNVILKVTLPNISEHCTNDENIFTEQQIRNSAVDSICNDKLRFYSQGNENSVLTDGITSM